MRGFDRPLKPEWIYKIVKLVKIGDKISALKFEMENCIPELEGDGNRKVRTIINRYFLSVNEDTKKGYVSDSVIIKLIKNLEFDEAKNVMFFILLIQEPILQYYSSILKKYFLDSEEFDLKFLQKLAIEKTGERDISGRSLRNFINTLVDFNIMGINENKNYFWKDKLFIRDELWCELFKIYGEYFLKSPQIFFEELNENVFFYFEKIEIDLIAKRYNGEIWDYVKRGNNSYITLYEKSKNSLCNNIG